MNQERNAESLGLRGVAIIAGAIGAVAVGAFAIGALAIGRLAIRRLVIENASDVHIGSRIKNPYASYLCDVRAVPPGAQRKSPCRGARQTKCSGRLPSGRQRQRPGKSPGLQSLR